MPLEVITIFLLFHIAVPLIIFEIPQIKNKFKIHRLALIIGSVFPDILDKSILFLGLGAGRGFAHSLLIVFLSFFLLSLLTRGNYSISIPFLIGNLFHLLLDLPGVPVFWPFIIYDFHILDDPIGSWLTTLFTNPIIMSTELIGLLIFIFIMFNNKLYTIHTIIDFLTTSDQNRIDDNTNN